MRCEFVCVLPEMAQIVKRVILTFSRRNMVEIRMASIMPDMAKNVKRQDNFSHEGDLSPSERYRNMFHLK